MHRPKSWNESGVSEVVGTILILLMTVVLFSTIIVWVSTIPTPAASIRLDMDGALTPIFDDTGAWAGGNITVQHRGGETLEGFRTSIFLTVERGGTFTVEHLKTQGTIAGVPYGIDGPNPDWDAGETWAYTNYSYLEMDKVTITVVDNVRSLIVWNEALKGVTGVHPPLFLEKWLDGDTATAFTQDVPLTNRPFGIYARIVDQDGDLDPTNATFTLTFGPQGTYALFDDGTNGDRVAEDGIFSRFNVAFKPQKSWDGGIILLRAKDFAGHITNSRLVFEVREGPTTPGCPGCGQGPFDLYFKNEFQAYAIYLEAEWDALKWAGNETRTFKKGEVMVVIVASQYLKNLDLKNDLMVFDPNDVPPRPTVYSNSPYNQNPAPSTKPSSTRAFTFLEFVSDFYVYEYRTSTDSAAYGFDGVQLITDITHGQYSIDITLRASNVAPPRNQFTTVDAITVTDASGNAPLFPAIEFFSDAAHTLKTNEFKFTDIMYVRVRVQNTDASVTAGDVFISDFIGGVQIWAPPGIPPVGSVQLNGSTFYKFTVDLSNPNVDPWIIGRNSYGFQLKWIRDANEDYVLSSQVIVHGPQWKLDIASALEEFSHPVFSEKWYAIFHENDELWSQYLIERFQSSPSEQNPSWGGGKFYQIVFSDFDEDNDLDVVTGLEKSKVFLYRNTFGNGHTWERTQVVDYGSAEVWAVAAGRIDQDSDHDIVSGLNDGRVYWYSNQGSTWPQTLIVDLPVEIKALKIADADMDKDKDVFVGRKDGQVTIYKNNGLGGFPASQDIATGAEVFDLVIADMDNDGDNDLVVARGVNIRIYLGPAFTTFTSLSSTTNALAVDVGLIDGDALLDVVAGTDTGVVYWWRNGPWTRTTVTTLPDSDKVLSLRVGDVDGDFLDDFVIGTEKGWVRWFRHLVGGSWDNIPVSKVSTKVFDIDIGDADRGVIIDRSK